MAGNSMSDGPIAQGGGVQDGYDNPPASVDADAVNKAELERTLAGKANPPAEQVRPVGDSRNNVMRHDYPPLNTTEVTAMRLIKDRGLELWELLDTIGRTDLSGGAGASTDDSAQQAPPNGSRELSLAKTKVEEAVMWATKHISR